MKKLFNLLIVMSIFIFINNGCKKCDDNPSPNPMPTTLTTINDLNGTWEFVNASIGGKIFTNCTDLANDAYLHQYPGLLLSFNFNSTAGTCTVTDKCSGIIEQNYPVTFDGTTITTKQSLFKIGHQFRIQSYNRPTLIVLFSISTDAIGGGFNIILTVKKI